MRHSIRFRNPTIRCRYTYRQSLRRQNGNRPWCGKGSSGSSYRPTCCNCLYCWGRSI